MSYWSRSMAPRIWAAWDRVVEEDSDYFEEETHEDAVSTDLINELRQYFKRPKWRVSGQYNRMNAKRSAKRIPKETLIGGRARRIRPDIIIHRLGADGITHNLLMLEIKKWPNTEWRSDVKKLKSVTSIPAGSRKYQYKYGLLIRYRRNMTIGSAQLFINGEVFELNTDNLTEMEE